VFLFAVDGNDPFPFLPYIAEHRLHLTLVILHWCAGKALRINHNIVKRSILELHTFDRSAVQRKKNNNIGLVSQNHRISSEKNQRANSDAILLLEALHHHRHGSFATYYSLSQSCRLIRLPFVPHPSSHTSPKFRPTSFELSTLESIATPTKFQPLSKLKSPITLAYPPTVSFGTNHTRWECDNISLDGLPSSSRSIFVSLFEQMKRNNGMSHFRTLFGTPS
jgi:hypothetical protein